MKTILRWLGLLAKDILTSDYVKSELRKLWDKYDRFDDYWGEFVNLIKKV